jgi:hypothetical protein
LRDRLRAGDVWVVGSRQYRAFEERLISRETPKELERGGTVRYFFPRLARARANNRQFSSVFRESLQERIRGLHNP